MLTDYRVFCAPPSKRSPERFFTLTPKIFMLEVRGVRNQKSFLK